MAQSVYFTIPYHPVCVCSLLYYRSISLLYYPVPSRVCTQFIVLLLNQFILPSHVCTQFIVPSRVCMQFICTTAQSIYCTIPCHPVCVRSLLYHPLNQFIVLSSVCCVYVYVRLSDPVYMCVCVCVCMNGSSGRDRDKTERYSHRINTVITKGGTL